MYVYKLSYNYVVIGRMLVQLMLPSRRVQYNLCKATPSPRYCPRCISLYSYSQWEPLPHPLPRGLGRLGSLATQSVRVNILSLQLLFIYVVFIYVIFPHGEFQCRRKKMDAEPHEQKMSQQP